MSFGMSKPILPQGKYKFVNGAKTNYTNDTGHWLVLMGMDYAGFSADNNSVTIALSGLTIDGLLLKTFGVAADEIILYLPRHLLVPPGAVISSSSAVGLTLIECVSLEDALAIL